MATRILTPLKLVAAPLKRTAPTDRAVTEIYRPFFLSGVLCVLTAGCLLGAIALAGIGLRGSFLDTSWTPFILAHANSQLYGWVGLFVMGFALQQHAPQVGKLPQFYKLAKWSLGLIGTAILIRFAAELAIGRYEVQGMVLGIVSGIMLLTAVAVFMANIALTRYKDGKGLTWQTKFVFASLGWWVFVAMAEPFYFALSHQTSASANLSFIAQYFPPYREAQFLGFVTCMIFGVALVKMNSCFGAREPDRRLGNLGFVLWNGGLLMRMAGWIVYFRASFTPSAAGIYLSGGILLALSACLLVKATRIFEPLSISIRSHKFVRAAFGWLLVGGGLILLEPLHLSLAGQSLSHAYTGAMRHAITVGFISQMIVGVATHVVAVMNDADPSKLRSLWSVFWLLNIGNAFRVGFEIATDYTPGVFFPMGLTGFIELTALILWAVDLFQPIIKRRRIKAYA